MSNKAFSRTALATLGLLIIMVYEGSNQLKKETLTFVSFISYSLPYDDFSPKGELIILGIQKALWWITSCIPSNLIIHLVGKYQLHQHKGVCYRQVATHPMTACLGGANVLRKQELRLCWTVIAPIICFYTYRKEKEWGSLF